MKYRHVGKAIYIIQDLVNNINYSEETYAKSLIAEEQAKG